MMFAPYSRLAEDGGLFFCGTKLCVRTNPKVTDS
jgi:hypothetical protein